MAINKVEKTVVVLGMHRSGTSLIAGMLQKLGVNMGKKQVGIHWSNPLGHFENIDFVKMDDKILEKAGGTWDNPPNISKILKLKSDKALIYDIKKVIERNEDRIWGWKTPTTSLTVELYLPYLKNPYFVTCHRNTEAIINSLRKRDNMDAKKALLLTEIYIENIKKFFERHPKLKYMEIQHENVVNNPREAVQKLIEFLGITISSEQIDDAVNLVLPPKQIKQLQEELKKKEILLLIKDTLKNPYLVRRYVLKAIKDPKYTLKKLGLR